MAKGTRRRGVTYRLDLGEEKARRNQERFIHVTGRYLPRVGEKILLMSYASNKDQTHRRYEVTSVEYVVGYWERDTGRGDVCAIGRQISAGEPTVAVREIPMH